MSLLRSDYLLIHLSGYPHRPQKHRYRSLWLVSLSVLAFFSLAISSLPGWVNAEIHPVLAAIQTTNPTPVVTVSAASFEATAIAPDAVVAAFGNRLATQTAMAQSIPFPTILGGTSVQVNGRAASLLIVSPERVQFIIPSNTEIGRGTVTIRSGDGTVSTGVIQVRQVAPAIFTANNPYGSNASIISINSRDNQGVPFGSLVRVKNDGTQSFEPIAIKDPVTGNSVAIPINLGPPSDRVFLILFLCGIRHAPDPNGDGSVIETVRIILGGNELIPGSTLIPLYAGPQGSLPGLDQINAEIPRSLANRGRVRLSVTATGIASNIVELVFASSTSSTGSTLAETQAAPTVDAAPQVSSFNPTTGLAGQTLRINGTGFSANPVENLARINGVISPVTSASPTQLSIVVPFGAEPGLVSVRTAQGEGASASALALNTSISGFAVDTASQPLRNVTVEVVDRGIQATTGADGSFILPNVPPGLNTIQFKDLVGAPLPFPPTQVKINASSGRDNQFLRPVTLQKSTGPQGMVGTLTIGNVSFEILPGATTTPLTLTLVENGRPPADVPPGNFNSNIVQITPFGQSLNPGGKLVFPNTENLAPGTTATIFRFDQTKDSITLGTFIEAGQATVSANGQRIETATGAITQTGYYFVSTTYPTTTVIGRILESGSANPVMGAIVRANGLETFTDGNGGFTLRYVPIIDATNRISVETSITRLDGRVDRTQRGNIPATVRGITTIDPNLTLPSEGGVVSTSGANFVASSLASEAIIAAFGPALAKQDLPAPTVPLPTSLAGTTVKVRDSAGIQRLAPLFFVSANQVNFQMPEGTADGMASVTITNGDGGVASGLVDIVRVAPGLFSATANGQGVAVGSADHFRNNQMISSDLLAQFDITQNKWVSVPIDLGPSTDLVFLILYGTGIRFNSSLSKVSATMGGVDATVTYANAAPGLVGADQINILIPRTLVGRGEVDVVLTVDGKTANTVKVNIR